MKCYQAKAGELSHRWYVIDASGQVVGRLAAQIAPILMGKHRPTYTPHIDTGDYVIVTNVDKVVFTGNKWQEKTYQRYSGYPGGQRDEAAWKLFQRRPERILELAIQRMMPKNKLGRHMMDKLKLYTGPDHPHQAQCPAPLEPLSGRPTASGALFAPPPVPKAPRKRTEEREARTKEPAESTPTPGPQAAETAPHDEPQEAPAAELHSTAPEEAGSSTAPHDEHAEPPPAEPHSTAPEEAGTSGESHNPELS
jgi:large subunit ribosomal protein L13